MTTQAAAFARVAAQRGRYHAEDFARLTLTRPVDLVEMKGTWLAALAGAQSFVGSRPAAEMGCLYYAAALERSVDPSAMSDAAALPHFGRPGGVMPRVV